MCAFHASAGSAQLSPGACAVILIAGASGLLGSNLAFYLKQQDISFHGTYLQHALHADGGLFSRRDLSQPAEVTALFAEVRPELVVNCSAFTNVDSAEASEQEALTVNALLPELLAKESAARGAKFVHISTDGVFDGSGTPLHESDPPRPLNAYARGKLEGERRVLAAHPGALVIRTCIYGWNAIQKESLAEWVLRNLREGKPITGFTDVTFNPLYVEHLSELILALARVDATGIVHTGTRDAVNKCEFARQVAEDFGADQGLIRPGSVAQMKFRAARPNYTVLDCARAEELLGRTMPLLREGIHAMKSFSDGGNVSQLKSWGER
jgi:dTDP-4-dehydrorhamnose reductase